ncbi:MarR family winged helix-turn-helix transcriptional regulator [Kribbella sp. NPDC049174]|uniref:MarR family winged helix-turn-helix transcriptional regulator n=1 Tax=Kribbella sp. NPDC049174 TaxID=3364112 RepID=UPI00371757B8
MAGARLAGVAAFAASEGNDGTWFSDRGAGPASWDDAFMADELGGSQPPAMLGNLTFLLAMAGGSARVRVEEVLSAFGIGMRGLGILAHIAAEPDLSYSALARRSNVTVQTMTASIKALQTSGHIAPRNPTQAGRAARLLLTPHGQQTLAAVDQSIAAVSDSWLPLDADERRTLASLLGKVVRATVERTA